MGRVRAVVVPEPGGVLVVLIVSVLRLSVRASDPGAGVGSGAAGGGVF